ncbi:MAG: hypothetical protein H0T46_00740 [Deltaproteobacteria bacterium]|nr:hypothetical protein [Deltaproteobacteria bacterium]
MKRALLAALLLVACGKSETVRASHEVLSDDVIPSDTLQLVTAIVADWSATATELRVYERTDAKAPWRLVMGPWPGVVGKGGTGWGMGRHGRGPYPNRSGPLKQEGDGRSPAGAFLLPRSFGYADTATTDLPYQRVDASWKCVDDPKSTRYNTILDERTVKVDWRSAEDMRRSDELYTWVVDVAHNPTRIPNGGSCIFLHVWGGPASATVGCTAMEEPQLAKLIGTLKPRWNPMFVLLPKSEYSALAPAWNLPAP